MFDSSGVEPHSLESQTYLHMSAIRFFYYEAVFHRADMRHSFY